MATLASQNEHSPKLRIGLGGSHVAAARPAGNFPPWPASGHVGRTKPNKKQHNRNTSHRNATTRGTTTSRTPSTFREHPEHILNTFRANSAQIPNTFRARFKKKGKHGPRAIRAPSSEHTEPNSITTRLSMCFGVPSTNSIRISNILKKFKEHATNKRHPWRSRSLGVCSGSARKFEHCLKLLGAQSQNDTSVTRKLDPTVGKLSLAFGKLQLNVRKLYPTVGKLPQENFP